MKPAKIHFFGEKSEMLWIIIYFYKYLKYSGSEKTFLYLCRLNFNMN